VLDKSFVTSGRYRALVVISVLMLMISFLTRIGLIWYEGKAAYLTASGLFNILATGLVYDLAALTWILIPFSLNALIWSNGPWGRKMSAVATILLFAIFSVSMVFNASSEFVFWNEFGSRFNFIAVDYLVYTREVIGNIQQSYPFEWILAGIGTVSLIVFAGFARRIWCLAGAEAPPLKFRFLIWLGLSLLPVMVFFGLGEDLHRQMQTPSARELASNGIYSFFRAFRNNELSYPEYYRLLSESEVRADLKGELLESHASSNPLSAQDPMARHIVAEGPMLRKNIVLVSIESLGSDYVESFGGRKGLTPNLDALSAESLTFHNLYATGLRTVRGLEAISLSMPPTPGRAVPIRERNKGLQTLGSILKGEGYDALYLYGGYAMFDNMRDFFSGNGYDVIDRTSIPASEISHETIWGVADEDLYHLTLRELDARAAKGKPFFAHIMTTSNHRPYTYPGGRVAIPSHTGRDGAVQYTDWAIGEFLASAKKHPWFADTVFVILADHTSNGRGRIDLPPENYRIPMWFYAPGFIKPGRVEDVASQIDVAPTLLALLNLSYDSHFYGQDILLQAAYHPRAFMANYLTVGYMEQGMIVELGPRQFVRVMRADSGKEVSLDDKDAKQLVGEAISYYQNATAFLEHCAHKTAMTAVKCSL
jgi:phosphoglycerol transferase MdoB-like AlkP superfamily enzyme